MRQAPRVSSPSYRRSSGPRPFSVVLKPAPSPRLVLQERGSYCVFASTYATKRPAVTIPSPCLFCSQRRGWPSMTSGRRPRRSRPEVAARRDIGPRDLYASEIGYEGAISSSPPPRGDRLMKQVRPHGLCALLIASAFGAAPAPAPILRASAGAVPKYPPGGRAARRPARRPAPPRPSPAARGAERGARRRRRAAARARRRTRRCR